MDVDATRSPEGPEESARFSRAIGAFVALGILLRILSYAANPPLWGDEACLAFNFLDRGYLDLLRPLDYGQVAPPLFLWAERAIVGVLGFSEPSLRLFPLLCGVASVLLFRRLAGLTLRGLPRLLAVAIFAVSVHPIRHASDVKPYASDLLMALALLTPAFAWLRRRDRTAPLWTLAGLAPIALLTSYPAAFVAAGVGLGLTRPVWKSGRVSMRVAIAAYGLAVVATSMAVFALVAMAQGAAVGAWMDLYWSRAFPPSGAWPFVRWLFLSTAGSMLSYPDGGRDGGSIATFALMLVAGVVLLRRRRRAELTMLVSPFAVTLAASAFHRYPYGGEARTMQFVAPSVCLLAGLGGSAVLAIVPRRATRRRLAMVGLALLAAVGAVETSKSIIRPYRSAYDERVRSFARDFWPSQARDAEVACLRRDFGIVEDLYARRGILNGRTPVFVCNQRIYSPSQPDGPRWDRVSATHPLRCVLYYETDPGQPEFVDWLAAMQSEYDLARAERFEVNVADPGVSPKLELIHVFDFTPKAGPVAPGRDVRVATRPSGAGRADDVPRAGR